MKRCIFTFSVFLCLFLGGCDKLPAESNEAVTLNLAVLAKNRELENWVFDYNKNHPDVRINIINYADGSDYMEALNMIKIEIAAGKGPDLINFDIYYSPVDASSGILADLYPFIKNDLLFDKQDYLYNITQSFAVGENLYVMVPQYTINTFATVNAGFREISGLNINKLMEVYENRAEGTILFPGETKMAVFGMICYGSMNNYIDWEKGVCHFDSESFKKLLHFANQFPLHLNIANDFSVKDFYTEGRTLLYPVFVGNVFETATVRTLLGESPAYVGYPLDSGIGHMASILDIAIGISENSLHKEAAWEFIKSLLGADYQNNLNYGLPLHVQTLEGLLEEAMKTEFDEYGEKIVKEQIRFEGEDVIDIYEITKDDAESLKSILESVEISSVNDNFLYNILLEEVEYLFSDNRNVDDVANIINNRAQVYVNENR